MRGTVRPVQEPVPIMWPWFVAGVIFAPISSQFSRWAPEYIAGALAFFLLFSLASVLVARRQSPRISLLRLLAASAGGALIGAAIRYMFP